MSHNSQVNASTILNEDVRDIFARMHFSNNTHSILAYLEFQGNAYIARDMESFSENDKRE